MTKSYSTAKEEAAHGTYKIATLTIPPAELVRCLGYPHTSGDAYKSSGEYILISSDGEVFTIYDWKSTRLYNKSYPHPAEFWACEKEVEFSIGGKRDNDIEAFLCYFYLESFESEPVYCSTLGKVRGFI